MTILQIFKKNDIFTTTGIACNVNRLNYRYNVMFDSVKTYFKNSNVLDIGCHNGRWSWVSTKLGAKKVIGIDADENILKLANNIFKDIPTVNFHKLDINYLNLNQFGEIDVVLCMGILYYLSNPFDLIKKIARINPKLCIIDTFCSHGNVPNQHDFNKFLMSQFKTKKLVCYDDGKRVSWHCFPKTISLL